MIRGIYAILVLDLKRAWLDRARLAAGIAQPLLYLFVLGPGLGSMSRFGGAAYSPYIFPGVIGLNLLFTSTFAAIGIVFDRQIGFLKAVLVAPMPRSAVALGKVAAGGLQAFFQAALLLPFAPLAGIHFTVLSFFELVLAMLGAAMVFSAMGVAVAGRFTSTTVFPIVSNAVLLPMFFLSGALYPLQHAPYWMRVISHLDPVAYAVDLMRGSVIPSTPAAPQRFFCPPGWSILILAAFFALLIAIAVNIFNRGEDDSSLGATQFNWRRR